VFRIPRAAIEVEVSHLEAQGFRVKSMVPDGSDIWVIADPLWQASSPRDTGKIPRIETRPIVERPDWFVESDSVAGETR
jgi:hypothetical protein